MTINQGVMLFFFVILVVWPLATYVADFGRYLKRRARR